jgi:hypothetical protein
MVGIGGCDGCHQTTPLAHRQALERADAPDAPVGIAQRAMGAACGQRDAAATIELRTSRLDMTHHALHRSPIAPRDAGGAAWSEPGNLPTSVFVTGLFMQLIAAH